MDSKIEMKSEGKLSIAQNGQADKVCSAQQLSYFSKRNASRGPFVKLGEAALRGSKLLHWAFLKAILGHICFWAVRLLDLSLGAVLMFK